MWQSHGSWQAELNIMLNIILHLPRNGELLAYSYNQVGTHAYA